MGKLKQIKILAIIMAIIEIGFGIVLIALPEATKLAVCYFAGAILILAGIFAILDYFMYGFEPFGFVKGVLDFVIGLIFICGANTIASPQVFSFIFGLIFIVRNIFKIQDSFDYRRMGINTWFIDLVFACIMLAFGIVLLVNPFGAEKALIIFLAVSIIVDGLTNLIVTIMVASKAKKVKKSIKEFFAPIKATYVVKEGDENANPEDQPKID